MSILNRLRLNRHLDDSAITALWTESALGGKRPSHPHLRVCAPCRTRVSLFAEWLDDLRVDAAAEADEAFPSERLAIQQAQIYRRLEAAERPARVISFPKFAAPTASRPSTASRWIAAAAAAGLVAGVGLGQVMDFRYTFGGDTAARLSTARPVAESPAATVTAGGIGGIGGDEAFLLDLDTSLSRPSVPELRAIDDFTPRAGEHPQ